MTFGIKEQKQNHGTETETSNKIRDRAGIQRRKRANSIRAITRLQGVLRNKQGGMHDTLPLGDNDSRGLSTRNR
jgi:hypothetical protein